MARVAKMAPPSAPAGRPAASKEASKHVTIAARGVTRAPASTRLVLTARAPALVSPGRRSARATAFRSATTAASGDPAPAARTPARMEPAMANADQEICAARTTSGNAAMTRARGRTSTCRANTGAMAARARARVPPTIRSVYRRRTCRSAVRPDNGVTQPCARLRALMGAAPASARRGTRNV